MPRRKIKNNNCRKDIFWEIGLYTRLSREDDNTEESESVTNQDKILRDFADEYFEPGTYRIVHVFIDDGLTGTDTSRAEFQRMKECVEKKEINCVIFKSLARGFRNLGDQTKFIEEFIPRNGARFINMSSPFIDTYIDPKSSTTLEVPIRGMFNEQFAAQTSEEVRKTFDMKRKRGEFIGAFAPYGYKKDPENKNKLIIDEEVAPIVRNIFHWFVNGEASADGAKQKGMSKRGIALKLDELGIPNPSKYKKQKGINYQNPHSNKSDGLWSVRSVGIILQNAMYVGTMVQGKQRVISYKVHEQISVPEDEWYIVPNMHDAIVEQELFDKAQKLHGKDTRANSKKEVYLFSGFMRCPDCDKAMHRKSSKGIVYYHCRSYVDKKVCSKHTIRLDRLENAVLKTLQQQIALADNLLAEVERINNAPIVHRESKRLEISLEKSEKQLNGYQSAIDDLYLDWKTGELTKEEYQRLKTKLSEKAEQLEQNIFHIKDEINIMANGIDKNDPYLTHFLKYKNIKELSRGILVELIDTIWVHENGELTIDLNFADQYQRIIEYIQNNQKNLVLVEKDIAI